MNTNEEIIDINETAEEIADRLKLEYPTLRTGNENDGYIELSEEEYELKINEWVSFQVEKINMKKAEIEKTAKKAELLSKLGITEEEAKLLLS